MNLPSWQPKGYYCNEIWPHSCIHSSYKVPFRSHTRSFTVGTPLPASQPDKHPNTACTSMIHHNPGKTGTSKASGQAVLSAWYAVSHSPTRPAPLCPQDPAQLWPCVKVTSYASSSPLPLCPHNWSSWCSRAGPEMRTPWCPPVTPKTGLACPIPHVEGWTGPGPQATWCQDPHDCMTTCLITF